MEHEPKNAAPTAMGDGVENCTDQSKSCPFYDPKHHDCAMPKTGEERLKSAIRVIAFTLISDSDRGSGQLASCLFKNLTEGERTQLAFAILCGLTTDTVEQLCLAVVGDTGGPLPTLISVRDEAEFWANLQSNITLKAYLLAAYMALPTDDRIAFLLHLDKELPE
ncbi:MAG: hypothetical protein R3186_01115 [Ruegeria sp.]|nr:hypothetical protein [Ruegeria sp.]